MEVRTDTNNNGQMSFKAKFQSSARMKLLAPHFLPGLTTEKEAQLAKDFLAKTASDKNSTLIAANLSKGFGKMIFILKRGNMSVRECFYGRDWASSVDKLMEVYKVLVKKMK